MHREFAVANDIKVGMLLMADSGFKCLECHSVHIVRRSPNTGALYVECDNGEHYIADHKDLRGRLEGFYLCEGLN